MTHTVTVNPDGSFSPRRIQIHDGDTVEWRFHDRTDAIIPVDSSGPPASLCSAYKPYDPADPNEFTGPMPRAASGIFTLGPDGPGLTIETPGRPNPSCDYNRAPDKAGNQYLCNTGEPEAYEQKLWEAETAGPVLNPNASRRTIGEWTNEFHQRRRNDWAQKLGDPLPLIHRHTFKRTISSNTPTNSSSTTLTRRNAASALRRSMAWL